MKRLSAVIGSNYGDEGKGLVTDWLAHEKSVVVRYNGGAQAGHTVVSGSRKSRHVFHHVGSGMFRGAKTFLSKYFIINPILFAKEEKELSKVHGYDRDSLRITADPNCIVTTPYDMALSQLVEFKRGNNRHGSCGVGINETVVRNQIHKYSLRFYELRSPKLLMEKLKLIRDEYLPQRAKDLEVSLEEWASEWKILSEEMLDRFFDDIIQTMNIKATSWMQILEDNHDFVFEGAQGLHLDMDSKDFPHVTRSKTGLNNILRMMTEANLTSYPLSTYFVTRTYMTRHGAGPLLHECEKPYQNIHDETNIPNEFQGTLRYALLDIDRFFDTIVEECDRVKLLAPNIWPFLVVTCADQLDKDWTIKVFLKGDKIEMALDEFAVIAHENGIKGVFVSKGPTREDISGTI